MTGNSRFGLLIFLFLVFSVLIAGCSSESSSAATAAPTPAHPVAKYGEGDIIATASTSTASSLYIILQYDSASDAYTRAFIEKNADGSWGHRSSNRTEKSPRTLVEKVYTVRVGHIALSSVPIVTLTVPPATTPAYSGKAPSISNISPNFAAEDATVSVTISGTNFQNGATVKLVQPGSSPVTATAVSASAASITCFFNLNGKEQGSYTLIVMNPDGQSDSRQNIFTIGEAPPVIAGVYPNTAELNETVSLSISGQNFKDGVKVSFKKDTTELVCMNPSSMDSTKISCSLDLRMSRGASTGNWAVTVINIDGQQKGTWNQNFVVTNSTAGSS